MPFGHKAGLPPSKKYLLMRQPLRLKYMLLKVEDQFDFVGMNCAMRPAKSAIF